MEKISIHSTYTKVSLYAKLTIGTAAAAAKPQDGAAKADLPAPKAADDGACADGSRTVARSQDGDTFTLSFEARAISVTRSITSETSEDAGGARPSESDRLSSGGRARALMDMLEAIAERRAQGHSGRRHHNPHFPKLADADDLAATMLDHWKREHAERGGSRRGFADELLGRLDKWRAGGSGSVSRVTLEVEEFRAEVSLKVTAGLGEWAGGEPDAPSPAT